MTTIILDKVNKILYADKQESYGYNLKIKCNKISPLKINGKRNGWIALAGDSDEGEKFIHFLSTHTWQSIFEKSETKPKFEKLGGFICLANGKTYCISASGIPLEFTDTYMADGQGYLMAMVLLDAKVSIPEIFKIINKRALHTSSDYDYIYYDDPQTEIKYCPNE